MTVVLPDWIRQVRGRSPVLLVAPHGGRRPARSELETRVPRKANDLHTADLTLELARRTGASAIVNGEQDRNRVDLNRVSHVQRSAPWLFALLLHSVREQIRTAGEAMIVFIHGWNAIQASCDVGIGARLDEGRLVPVREGVPTIPARVLPRLLRFARDCGEAGIEVVFADRYPAAARENVLQIFTRRYADHPDAAVRELAELGAAGKIAAVQLELGIPLRWPGPLRERFLERLTSLLVPDTAATAIDEPRPPLRHDAAAAAPARWTLEFHDPASGIGGFAGMERAAAGRRQGRFLLCLGRSRLGLFTGEHPHGNGHPFGCAGLRWNVVDRQTMELRYEGPFLVFERSDPFLDLEEGLAEASLATLDARLEWHASPAASPPGDELGRSGRVRGVLELDGSRFSIDAPAIVGPVGAGPPARWRERRLVHADLGRGLQVSVLSHAGDDESATGRILREERAEPILSARLQIRSEEDGATPAACRMDLVTRSGPLRIFGQVGAAVPVVRGADGVRMLTFFGLARFQSGDRVGHGTFEIARRLESPA